MKKLYLTFVMILASFIFVTSSHAAESPISKKLKRGFTNILSSPLEIPKQVVDSYYQAHNDVPSKAVWTLCGLVKGAAYTMGRMGSGFVDVLASGWDKFEGPLMTPDYVGDEWPKAPAQK